MATNDAWRALVQVDALEPGLPICDSHHHLWDRRAGRVARRYPIDEIQQDIDSGHNIVATVFIEHLADATGRYYETAIELFGFDRCMFESNFPVDKVGCSYSVLWNSFKRVTAGCLTAEKAHLFHDTATRVYRLG